ncbi:hypothetical protein [Rubritalea sp.]|uniref:hypothetical protein n=1 Tax=Rubritalea sp. TaxID=2109375 RepID=UPI003EFA9153
MEAAFGGTDGPHVWANITCISGALLLWNASSVVERHIGKRKFAKLFLIPLPQEKD